MQLTAPTRLAATMFAALQLGGCAVAPVAESYYFDCDTPPAKFSEWTRTLTGQEFKISGVLKFEEPRYDAHWLPVATVFLANSDNGTSVGFRASVRPNAPDDLQLSLIGNNRDVVVISTVPWKETTIPFTVTLSKGGSLSVTANGSHESRIVGHFVASKASLGCSTSHARFRDVNISSER
jgi:hypothetical protein